MQTPAENQKLIAYGKQLEDNNKTLQEYGIKENDFLVLFVTKVTSHSYRYLIRVGKARAQAS
jgi:hypothetical protein